VAAPFEHLQAWVNELGQNRAGQEQLYQYYQTLRAILKNEPVDVPAPAEMPAPRMPALRTPEMEPAAPTPAANPVEARHKELRPAKPRADKMFHYAEVDRTESGKPIYYLTFDDGPRPDETRRILKVLAEKKVHATFFVLGENVKKYANTGILQEIAAGGHEICLHSYKHDEFIKLAKTTPVEQLYHDNVEVVNELLAQNNIPRSRIFRAPYGAMTKPQLKYFADRGIYVVHWSEVADEYKLTKAPQIIEMMTSSAKAGSIGLLHDVGVDSAQTAAAAPKVIDKLKAKKFAFGTMSQALGLRAFDEATTEAPTQAPVLPKDLKQPFEPEINQRAPAPAEPNVTLASVQNPTVERVDPFARAKASAKQEAPTSAPMPDKNPAPEAAEQLPKHYFAKTSMGTYVGWNVPRKEAYRYFEPGKQPKSNDLSAPFEGKNIDGSKSMVRLRAETFKAFIALKAEFDKTASAEARAIGLIVNEGFRTPEDQEKLLKKFGHTAAEDGVSTHQVGTGIDVYEGVTEEIYNALFEPQKCLKDPNYKPLAVRHGFVLMYPGESWHIEFAPGNMPNGKAIADAFWEQYGQKILKFQTKRLQSHAQRERERTQAKK
jgi:peptidoglycan/xylan/chitin deacetylase (PgdA/CDA1 family)